MAGQFYGTVKVPAHVQLGRGGAEASGWIFVVVR